MPHLRKSFLKGKHFVLVEEVWSKLKVFLNSLEENDLQNCFE